MQFISPLQTQINQAIEKFFQEKRSTLSAEETPEKELLNACNYATSIGGKRIRPILSILTYQALTKEKFPETFLPIILSVELIHAYSLVHDDLPSLDNDTLRRGHPTLWKKFGEDIAILAGDALQSFAYEIILDSENISPTQKVQILQILTQKSGSTHGMIGGQIRDIQSEKNSHLSSSHFSQREIEGDLSSLILTHQKKTGALIQAACLIGGILANTTKENLQKLSEYASHIGLAFQIKDDLLDLHGDEETTGKKCQKDQDSKGFIFLLGEEKTQNFLEEETTKAQHIAQNLQSSELHQIAQFIKNREK